jgi:DNA polymerase-3 subunit beta
MTTIELTPKVLTLIEQVSAADAQAELERRATPKSKRPQATSEAARQLFAPILRQIATGTTVVVAQPTPETAVSAETKAEIVHMPVVVVAEPVEDADDAPVAPIVPITVKSKPKARQRQTAEPKVTLRGLTPIQTEATAPELSLPVSSLVEALKAIEAPTKTRQGVLHILKSVVIQAAAGTVTLTTSDLDVTLQVEVAAKVAVAGTVAIPLKELTGILPTAKKNQIGDVTLRASDDEVTVTTQSGSSTLHSQVVADYPRLPESLPEGTVIDLDLEAIASVLPATAKEESRPILTGMLFDGDIVVATDSYRLHECSSPTMNVEKPMLVPHSFLAQLVKRGKQAKAIATNFQLLVTDETGLVAVSRLIEGEFPNYKSLFPTDLPHRIKFNPDQLIGVLANFLARKPGSTTPVRLLESKGGKLPIRMVEADRFDATVEISGSNPIAEVAYNPRYLRELVTGGFDHLKVLDALKPGLTERVNGGRRERRLLMPVNLNR